MTSLQSTNLIRPRPGPGTKLSAVDIADLSPDELDRILGADGSRDVGLLYDWVVRHTRDAEFPAATIASFCERLLEIGVPLDRYGSSAETLDAEHDAIGRVWLRGAGVTERIYIRAEDNPAFLASPFYATMTSRRWLELWLPTTDDSAFGVVGEFKAAGFVHYICAPLLLMSGAHAWVTFATRRPTGFSESDIAAIARVMPALALLIDMRSTWFTLDKLLRTYVGDEPHRAILRGNTKRGQVSTIKSAMLFADMRDSIGHTADLSALAAVDVFNALFDSLVPPIESRGGQVLKYIGDGLLAIFRETTDESCDAARHALEAAEDALRTLHARNVAHPAERPILAGIALHYGEAAYGNVGSGIRLDFTVIGKDVGLASRIAGMNRPLEEPLLMSAQFARRLERGYTRIGAFPARGFREPVEVFRPDLPQN